MVIPCLNIKSYLATNLEEMAKQLKELKEKVVVLSVENAELRGVYLIIDYQVRYNVDR